VLYTAVPGVTAQWSKLLIVVSAVTILYGNLCALPQRNLKRLFGYSSIAHAGYMLLGLASLSAAGQSAVLYYLCGYLVTVLGAFTVICLVMTQVEGEDITALSGLNQRAPLLAMTMTLAMVSLGGIPPLAGFFGKFLLFKAALARGATEPAYYWLVATAIAGVIISLYYYFGVLRAIFWGKEAAGNEIQMSAPTQACLYACILGMLALGIFPSWLLNVTSTAVRGLQ
jgi:NADH-quinone oxidoreductase subunit N